MTFKPLFGSYKERVKDDRGKKCTLVDHNFALKTIRNHEATTNSPHRGQGWDRNYNKSLKLCLCQSTTSKITNLYCISYCPLGDTFDLNTRKTQGLLIFYSLVPFLISTCYQFSH